MRHTGEALRLLLNPLTPRSKGASEDRGNVPLQDPGVLNWDESRSLRGVDRLLTSNAAFGDASLAAELRREKTIRASGDYRDKATASFAHI